MLAISSFSGKESGFISFTFDRLIYFRQLLYAGAMRTGWPLVLYTVEEPSNV